VSMTSDIIRGHTETMILAQLLEHDSYGYEINKSIRDRTGGAYEAKEGTLYTAFRRLEQAGYIRSYWGDESSGARRRYYAIHRRRTRLFSARAATNGSGSRPLSTV
jgi:Predicted transcriptional regulators